MTPVATLSTHDLVAVVAHPAKGRCIVATQPIAKGTRILSDPVVIVPLAQSEFTDRTVLGRYLFEWIEGGELCAVLGLGSLINHSSDENVEVVSNYDELTMDFVALRDIAVGEELVYDYGHDAAELASYYGIPAAS